MKKLILASASPRRRDLLKQIGLEFDIIPSNVDETIKESDPVQLVKKLALLKAKDVAQRANGLVIGADTIVVDGQTVLGKPGSKKEAFQMLKSLSGRKHQVMTGVAVVDSENNNEWVDVEITQVYFRDLSDAEIERYVASGEPMDKAGAYAIQGKGALFVEKIEGCFFNVVGLPLLKTVQILKKADAEIKKYI
ncbi:septum formation inhibitor Maf [Anoxybacter fermentans]|uniref:dTTP/UTP pyrophosphatase n=1 Tax=Anoxybacter fermentans TaxID=1323375 RepID=A0A3Q9HS82_9FIRM|nr:Maf family protein [Anoxybacter fermentans]AZR73289.1 septum formation inhibitor Maf [Anoxybacter fermentans]